MLITWNMIRCFFVAGTLLFVANASYAVMCGKLLCSCYHGGHHYGNYQMQITHMNLDQSNMNRICGGLCIEKKAKYLQQAVCSHPI